MPMGIIVIIFRAWCLSFPPPLLRQYYFFNGEYENTVEGHHEFLKNVGV